MLNRPAAIRCAGRRLVARRQADHAVELRALDGDLHVVDDEVAAGEHVAAAGAGADDEVARRGGADLERQAAGVADRLLDDLRDAVEVAEADRQLGRAVDDGDLRLQHVLVGEPERLPLRAPDRLARRAGLEITSERFLHSQRNLSHNHGHSHEAVTSWPTPQPRAAEPSASLAVDSPWYWYYVLGAADALLRRQRRRPVAGPGGVAAGDQARVRRDRLPARAC